jgi:hypothetical protein
MDLIRYLCTNFCSYYKPSKKEEFACRGFVVVERLIEKGKQIPFEKSDRMPGPLTGEGLRKVLCPTCSFYESDCDYILQEGEARPCGGLIFLALLMEDGIIGIDDVRNIE